MSSMILKEDAGPATPSAGYVAFYAKTDKLLYFKDDSGAEVPVKPSGGGTGDLLSDGSVALSANWDVGPFKITALQFESDIATGTAPFIVASSTVVANLNVSFLEGNAAAAFATAAQGATADSAVQPGGANHDGFSDFVADEHMPSATFATSAQGALADSALQKETIIVAASDETTDLTTGTAKVTFRMPYAFTLTEIRISVTTAPTGAVLTVDVNESGTSILSTKATIDAGEKTSETAATAPVMSDTSLADDAEITIDIDTVGSTIAGAGLKVYLIGNAT